MRAAKRGDRSVAVGWASVLLGWLVVIAAPASGLAGELEVEDLIELSLDDLLKVEVVSKRLEAVAEAPAVVTVYTRKDLDRLQPRTLNDLIELTTGFLVERDEDDIVWGTRGVLTDNNQKFLVAIDGHRLSNNANYGVNPFGKTRYLIDAAERIEIVRGPGGVLWGPDAFLGLVNVVTRRAASSGCEGKAKLSYGPGDTTWAGHLSWSRPLAGGGLSLFLNGGSSRGDEISNALAGRGGLDRTRGGYYERESWPSLTLHGRYERGKSWVAGQIVHVRPNVEETPPSDENEHYTQAFLEAGHRRPVGRSSTLSLRGYGDLAEVRRYFYGDQIATYIPEDRIGTEVLLESGWGERITTVFGWDSRFYHYDGGSVGPEIQPFSRNGRMMKVGDLYHNGLLGQVTGRFGDLVLNLGGRFDTFSDQIDNLFAPRVSIGYRFDHRFSAKILYTEGALRPSWAQLNAFFAANNTDGDDQLRAESSDTIELSASFKLDRCAGTLSVYRSNVADAINYLSGPRGFGFYNYADYVTWGLEWESRFRLGPRVEPFLNLTWYLDAARHERVEIVQREDPQEGTFDTRFVLPGTQDPYNLADVFLAAGVTFRAAPGRYRLELTPILRYRGPRILQGIDGQAGDREVDTAYVDLKGRLRATNSLDLWLNARNLFDDQEVVGIGSGQAGFVIPKGRTVEVGLSRRF